ncbi:hypothetical protein F5B18DRAFT_430567 [Nemania serpens]|nr:hypothetical protein F5B18DRAFT_430567 [Nemania serpens]
MATTRAWLDPKPHSVEGHTKQCILTFDGTIIWGPTSCHDNTTELRDALHKADSRFNIILMEKPHSVEGHTAYISVSAGGTVYLDKLNTHDNMAGLCEAVHNAQQQQRDQPHATHPSYLRKRGIKFRVVDLLGSGGLGRLIRHTALSVDWIDSRIGGTKRSAPPRSASLPRHRQLIVVPRYPWYMPTHYIATSCPGSSFLALDKGAFSIS